MIRSIKEKNKLCRRSIKRPTKVNIEEHKKFRNVLHHILRKEERDHYTSEFIKYKSNMRKTWGLIKDVINKKKKQRLIAPKFFISGKLTENPETISNGFNNYFLNVGKSLDAGIP